MDLPLTDQQEIEKALSRYMALQIKLILLIREIETGITGKTLWWTVAPMVARKFWKQGNSLELLFRSEWTMDGPNGEKLIVDLSSFYSLLRAMYEAYAVFCHLFKRDTNVEENIIRFHLWQIDGLHSRLNFKRDDPPEELLSQLDEDRKYIEYLKGHISSFHFFQALNANQQKFLLDKHAWKFSSDSLQRKESRKWQHSITELIQRTKIKDHILRDLYSYYSMHAHTGYVSILQSDDMAESDKLMGKWVAIMNASYVVAFMMDDLAKMFAEGEAFYSSLTQTEREAIASLVAGKN